MDKTRSKEFMYPDERAYYAQVLSELEGYTINMLDIKNDGRGVWAVTNAPEPNKEYTIFNMPRKTSGIIPREMPYKEGTYISWDKLEEMTEAKKGDKNTQNKPITLISVNHFKMEHVDQDLEKFKKEGAQILAVELPTNLQSAVDKFLESPQNRTNELEFGEAWNDVTIEENMENVRKTLENITGVRVDNKDVIESMESGIENPMDGNTTLKYLVNTIQQAHKMGFDIKAIDCPTSLKTQNMFEGNDEITEHRNKTMANNLAKISNQSNTVAIVGALHTDPNQKATPIQTFLSSLNVESKLLNYENPRVPEKELNSVAKPISKTPKKVMEEMGMQ